MEEQTNYKINTPIQSMVEGAQKDGTTGPLIGSIIIILIIIIGGLYFFSSLISAKKVQVQTEQVLEEQNKTLQIEQTAKQSESDNVSSIEADLNATNIDTVDKDLSDIEKEF